MKFKEYTQSQKDIYISEAKELCNYLDELMLSPHLGFGSLIGACRGGKLIDGDYDIDICYKSKFSNKKDVLNECKELYEILKNKGWLIKYWSLDYVAQDIENEIVTPFGQAHIKLGKHVIDLFTTWVDEEGNYNTCQWGDLGEYLGFMKSTLEGIQFQVPFNSDVVLTKLYGDWRTPSGDHPSKRIARKAYLKYTGKQVTSIVLKRFHCLIHRRDFKPKETYISSMERVEEILSKGPLLKIIKIE